MEAVIEKFRPVKEYEGLYEVSNYGAVRSLKFGKVKYLRNAKHPTGYERICLFRNNTRNYFLIHRLVWEAFVGPIPEGMEIDHVNAIRDDNRLDNLRVVTHKENSNNPITLVRNRETNQRLAQDPKWREANRDALNKMHADPKWRVANREAAKRRSKDPQWLEANRESTRKARSKSILQLNKTTGEVIREWECAADVERELGINHASISTCCHGKQNTAGGFRWRFASD